jgi:hypothetical protein
VEQPGLQRGTCYRWSLAIADHVGNGSTVTSPPVLVDGTPPVVAFTTLGVALRQQLTALREVPVRVAWNGSDPSGPVRYELRRTSDGTTFTPVPLASPSALNAVVLLPGASSQTFSIRATDAGGNVSDWVAGPSFTPRLLESTSSRIVYGGTWTAQSLTDASGGSVQYAREAGATARYTFTGRAIAWVSTFAPRRGRAEVYVDGVRVRTVDLYASTLIARRTAFTQAWASDGTHTVEIRVVGTADRPRVDVDAFVVLGGVAAP